MNFITHPHRWLRAPRQAHSYDHFYAIEAHEPKNDSIIWTVVFAVCAMAVLLVIGVVS